MPAMGSTQALKNQRAWLAALAKAKARANPAPAAAQAPAAGAPGAPGSAGAAPTTTPRADPFYNGQNQVDLANLNFDTSTGSADIDTQLKNLGLSTTYQQGQIDTSAKQNTGAANDNAAARGIFGSSIQKGNLADIEASRVVQRNYLDDQLKIATTAGEARKLALSNHARDVIGGLDQQAIGNADEINRQIPGDVTPATSGPATAQSPPDHAALIKQWQGQDFQPIVGVDSHGNHGTWHHFFDGRKPVFVKG